MLKRFVGNIPFNGEETKEALEKVVNDIMKKDPTFKAKIHASFIDDYNYILTVYDTDKDRLCQRLVWLKNKTPLKNQETPFWIKEK